MITPFRHPLLGVCVGAVFCVSIARPVAAAGDEAWQSTVRAKLNAMFPAYGFYVWHANNVSLTGLTIATQQPDARPEVSAGPGTESILRDGKN